MVEIMLEFAQMTLGLFLAGICLCRLNLLGRQHRLCFRVAYCLMLTAAVAAAFSPWMFTKQATPTLLLTAAVVGILLLPSSSWRGRKAPDVAVTKPGDLF